MIDLESLGYIDITEQHPIRFAECFGASFGTVYPYSKRFYKKEDNMTIELIVGSKYNNVDIHGTCYYDNGWNSFDIHAMLDDVYEQLKQTLYNIKMNIQHKRHQNTIANYF